MPTFFLWRSKATTHEPIMSDKDLIVLQQECYDKYFKSNYETLMTPGTKQVLEQIRQNGEVVLMCPTYTGDHRGYKTPMIFTNRNIYYIDYGGEMNLFTDKDKETTAASVYRFDEPLTAPSIQMLIHLRVGNHKHLSVIDEMFNVVSKSICRRVIPDLVPLAVKKFESVIRLIPGRYQNGTWRQLDGFFGMYYNEATKELSDIPPPSF